MEKKGKKCMKHPYYHKDCPQCETDTDEMKKKFGSSLLPREKSNYKEIPNGSDNETCSCACHDMKLGEPYAHDTECCGNINGFVIQTEGSSEDHVPHAGTMVGGTVNGHQGWCRCLYGNQPCDCPLREGVLAVVQDGNGGWEERLKKQRWYCDEILRHSSWSYAPELKDFIASEIKLAEERLVAKLKKIHEEYGIISITDLEHIQHED